MSDTGIPPNRKITTLPVLVIQLLLNLINKEFPDIKFVYDENLTYETAVTKLRSDNLQDKLPINQVPLFAFNRSVLKYSTEGIGKRAVVETANRRLQALSQPKIAETYHIPHLEFDLNFLYFTKSNQKMEEFEIIYLSEDGISQNKILPLDLTPQLGGILDYYLMFKPLDSKAIQIENNYYKQINGSVVIRGFFPVIQGQSPVILEIQKQIYNFMASVLWEHETIT
jgi:hypothetical protein